MFKSTQDMLDKISKYYPKPVTLNDVYVFPVILADNDLDRENEQFSDKALYQLADLLIGKTGFVGKTTARIFDTEVVDSEEPINKLVLDYKYIKAWCWIRKNFKNKDLIEVLENTISDRGSVSCAVTERICFCCGKNKVKYKCNCEHSFTILSEVTDAYEWSFEPLLYRIDDEQLKET